MPPTRVRSSQGSVQSSSPSKAGPTIPSITGHGQAAALLGVNSHSSAPFIDPEKFKDWDLLDKIKKPIAEKLAHDYYVNGDKPHVTLSAVTTYSGGQAPTPPPTEQRIALAIRRSLNLKKIGKGNDPTDWVWTLAAAEGRQKTRDERMMELLTGSAKLWAEERTVGKVEEIAINWIATEILGATAAIASGTAEIIGAIELLIDIAELLTALGEPAEMRSWDIEDAFIIANVKNFLKRKQEIAELKEVSSSAIRFEASPTKRDVIPR